MSNEGYNHSSTESTPTKSARYPFAVNDPKNQQNLRDPEMDPLFEFMKKQKDVNEHLHQQLKHQNEKYEKQIENLEMQKKQLIKEHNESLQKLTEDLQEQLNRNEELVKQNSKQMEKLELQNNQQIADLQSQLGDTNTINCILSTNYSQNQDEVEALLVKLDSTDETNSNDNIEVVRDVFVFDIPTFFCCILRFIYVIIMSAENTKGQRKSNYYVGVAALCLSIIFEALSENLNGKFKKIFTVNGIGAILYWVSAPIFFSKSTQLLLPYLIGGTIMILSEIILIIQMQKKTMPRFLILSHAYHVVAISFGMVANTFVRSKYIIVLFLLLHFIFMSIGLPIKVSKMIDNINHNTLNPISNAYEEHESEINLSIIENENDDIMGPMPNSLNDKSIIDILFQLNRRLDSLESQSKKSTGHFIFNGLDLKESNPNWITKANLSPDTYTMMTLSHWTVKTFYNPFSFCKKRPTLIEIPRPSKSWMLGLTVFFFQTSLALLTLLDQITIDDGDTPLNIPFEVTSVVRIGQFISLIMSIMTQRDVLVSYRLLLFLRYKQNVWRKLIDYEKDEKSFSIWLGRILFPNLMKSFQGLLVLVTTFIVIVQSENIVDLFKDFTALFVISSIDDMFFFIADNGYLGPGLSKKTKKAKKITIEEDDEKIHRHLYLFILTILFITFGGWSTVVAQQMTVSFLKKVYPRCPLNIDIDLIGNDRCDYPKNTGPNVLVCGWEGGDCDVFNFRYPNCTGKFDPNLVGDGKCDFKKNFGANKLECKWEGGDCDIFNVRYSNCTVEYPYLLGDGECSDLYNWEECGFDDGDCVELNNRIQEFYPNCTGGIQPDHIGNGVCDTNNNRADCGLDGGDCLPINNNSDQYPNCTAPLQIMIGDGYCHGGEYIKEECGFDGGDCANCPIDDLSRLGNGECDGDLYNTRECGFDYGDCTTLNYPDCKVDLKRLIGNGYCDSGLYNTLECGFDGGDCLEFNEKFPNCTVTTPMLIGDERCDNSFPYNTKECGFDGGDCIALNYPDCKVDLKHLIGNGYCDGGLYNTLECGFDGEDCLEFNEKFPNCTVDNPMLIGDGRCDNSFPYNTTECGFDGGDCEN